VIAILLNWRTWLVAALVASGAYLYHAGNVSGKAAIQSQFDAYKAKDAEQALAAQIERQTQESAMSAKNKEVTANYVSLQAATATAVGALDRDRMRLQAALAAYRGSTGKDSGTGLQIDDSAIVGAFSECVNKYSGLAKEADETSDTLKALQEYVHTVIER